MAVSCEQENRENLGVFRVKVQRHLYFQLYQPLTKIHQPTVARG